MNVTDSDFKVKVVERSHDVPVVVDFWATWCAPCMMLKPVLEQVAEELKDKFVLAKVNTDENPKVSDEFGINAIPAVKLFKDGKVVAEFTGMIPEGAFREWLSKNL